jgi:sugar (pentulose or hexulose) kinase
VGAAVRVTGAVEPDAEWSAVYRERLDTFRALYPALHAVPSTPTS